jgi:hypothetical protein
MTTPLEHAKERAASNERTLKRLREADSMVAQSLSLSPEELPESLRRLRRFAASTLAGSERFLSINRDLPPLFQLDTTHPELAADMERRLAFYRTVVETLDDQLLHELVQEYLAGCTHLGRSLY